MVRDSAQTVKLDHRVKQGDLSDTLEPHMTCYDIMYYLNTVLEQLCKCFYIILVRIANAFIASMRVTNTSWSIIQYDSWSCLLWILIGPLYNMTWDSCYLYSLKSLRIREEIVEQTLRAVSRSQMCVCCFHVYLSPFFLCPTKLQNSIWFQLTSEILVKHQNKA